MTEIAEWAFGAPLRIIAAAPDIPLLLPPLSQIVQCPLPFTHCTVGPPNYITPFLFDLFDLPFLTPRPVGCGPAVLE